ncbi:rhodanese-like domain-containing protein [Arcticibacterium luteifluviistationis]|uniref:Sulfurtransferase n=1 Tax=Arcticibacterium luteifluviistationis TaxID=1784714 RepID=A0A2Z4GAF7_9BACT|nr:rhodanese-like domain-containing protein [Arcticibacterium luteifluviistationis]AWV98187.1 sulfurtransferase [Arcticibacterium luteifluviistationis]
MKTNSTEITEINQKELKNVLDKENATIVDVRETSEFKDFNIGGINIPAHLLNEHLDELREFDTLIVACSNGARSYILAKIIQKKLPQKNVLHLTEGVF